MGEQDEDVEAKSGLYSIQKTPKVMRMEMGS